MWTAFLDNRERKKPPAGARGVSHRRSLISQIALPELAPCDRSQAAGLHRAVSLHLS